MKGRIKKIRKILMELIELKNEKKIDDSIERGHNKIFFIRGSNPNIRDMFPNQTRVKISTLETKELKPHHQEIKNEQNDMSYKEKLEKLEEENNKKTTMKVVCAWCEKDMGTVEVFGEPGRTTHVLCPDCEKKMLKELHEINPN
jgi:DNA-directed RNA polymerase subunit RPC12/RpoP